MRGCYARSGTAKKGVDVIDVGQHLPTLRRLAMASPYWRACIAVGWEREDLLQELALRVHVAQARAPYDPSRGSTGAYLYGVCHRQLRDVYEAAHARSRGGQGLRARRAALARGEDSPLPQRERTAAALRDVADPTDEAPLAQWCVVVHGQVGWLWVVAEEVALWSHGELPSAMLCDEAREVIETWAASHGIEDAQVRRILDDVGVRWKV